MSNFELKIEVEEQNRCIVDLVVYDSNNSKKEYNRIVHAIQRTTYVYDLPKGIYTVRTLLNSKMKDTVIVLDKEIDCFLSINPNSITSGKIRLGLPSISSSVLFERNVLNNYQSSHEYYTDPAVRLSSQTTFQSANPEYQSNESSLFIFLRFPSYERFTRLKNRVKNFFKKYAVLDSYGKTICSFEEITGIHFDINSGWVAFNANLPHGLYYLKYSGRVKRLIPIYLFKNWHSQFFMTLTNVPQFRSARVLFSKNKVFDPYNIEHQYADIFLNKLQKNDYSLADSLIEIAANGKHESPILGLLCAYIYLKSKSQKNDALFKTIIRNLNDNIFRGNENAPDLRALNLLAHSRFNEWQVNSEPVLDTPMFRVGFESIKFAAIENPSLIPAYSLNDYITENLFYDSPFNTFSPINFSRINKHNFIDEDLAMDKELKSKMHRISKSGRANLEIGDAMNIEEERVDAKFLSIPEYNLEEAKAPVWASNDFNKPLSALMSDDKIKTLVSDIEYSKRNKSWLSHSIAEMIKVNYGLNISDISKQLNVSGSTVSRVINEHTK